MLVLSGSRAKGQASVESVTPLALPAETEDAAVWVVQETDPQKRSAAAKTLEISADVAAQLQETVASGSFKLGREIEEESESFF